MLETDVGHIAALLALVCALYTIAAAVLGARIGRDELVRSARRGIVATGLLVALMAGSLLYALLTHDFAVKYVAQYSNREVPWVYDVSSLWAGQSGSLMFWCLLLNVFAIGVLWQNRGGRNRELMPYVMAALMVYQVFFLGLINFVVESPWIRFSSPFADGQGLMPLLQSPKVLVHPPMLYLGYVAFSVPFAFAMAALITGNVGDAWIRATRRWTLLAWFFLGCGLLLGANWAYDELGWGGYWSWDPVENVALMPWLTGTAFLHSILIQQRRGMLKIWNMALVILTFCLTLFGTFMNRSGVAVSVHAFEGSALGLPFVVLIGSTLVAAFALLYWRLPGLDATNRLDSFLSRESAFLVNNLLLVGITFAVFWGTIYPILSQAVRGVQVTVGAPFFDKVTGPLFLVLLLAMAAGPLLSWRRASPENLRRNLLRPFAAAALAGVAGYVLTRTLGAALSFAVCAAVIFTVAVEFYRGARAKRRATGFTWPRALVHLIDGNHSRYGGYLVHLGIALLAAGVAGSTLLKTDVDQTVRLGQPVAAGPYQATPVHIASGTVPGAGPSRTVTVRVTKDGQPVATLRPSYVLFEPTLSAGSSTGSQDAQAVPLPAIRTTPQQDLYVTLAAIDGDRVRLHVLVNPLLMWIWVGGAVVILGGLVSFSPDMRERRVVVTAPAATPVAAR